MRTYSEELLNKAYANQKSSSLSIIINTTILAITLYSYVDTTLLFSWYLLICTVSLLRLYSSFLYEKNRILFTTNKWKKIFFISVISSSLLLGMISVLFFVQDNYLHQAMIIMIISGISAGGIHNLLPLLRASQIFLLLLLLPLIVILFIQGTLIHTFMALLVLIYLVTMLYLSKQFHTNYLDLLRTRDLYEDEKNKLSLSQEKFQAVFKQAPLGIVLYDTDLIIQDINQEFLDFIGSSHEYIIGLDLHTLPDKRLSPSLHAIINNTEGFYEGAYTTKEKQKNLWISMHTSPLNDIEGKVIGGIGIIADITNRMLSELQFKHQARYDALTDIPNRSYLLEKISVEIARYKRSQTLFGIMFLDLDHFKNINDSLGHATGDLLLVETTQRLEKIIRESDTVARLGGDEFVILVTGLSSDENVAATEMKLIAKKVHTALEEPFFLNENRLTISSSIGITLISDASDDINDILKHADIAMYEAKKAGRNTSKFYKKDMDVWIQRRVSIENGLKVALENNEFEVYYQPVIDFSSAKIIGAEALIRWHNSDIENLYPDEFIPIAEESGLILEIGEWVLKNALAQFVAWQNEFGLKKIAVNISAYQFENPTFLQQLSSLIESSKIDPSFLELELVESALVEDSEKIKDKMQTLHDLGIGISLDDFGTGYSSLSYLKKLPFTTLKIDKSFVTNLKDDHDNRELINAILMIAKNFNFDVIAEGIETLDEYQYLKEKECNYFQGYYCSRPIPADQFAQLLKQNTECSKI